MKHFLFLVLVSVSFFACSEPRDDRATALCECHKDLGRIDPETDLELMNYVADSCKTLYIEILTELEDKPEEKAKFDEAYEFCQNEK
ncbi:hypothetical protein [Parvicella tangerina]|uniref:Lipoprotein n=1 Tax=Parvicella tangerina TaxID=2829795 RepID=A0A916JKL1_9FLAO|nr:hypothetical protein [Parvicella tangerina]CAG5077719.1 hypothetical protein CRYO30217_00465 [Parvicella tangerina]